MDEFSLFINIISIVVSVISIFISVITKHNYISLLLLIINLIILIILGGIIIPYANKLKKYKNLIKINKYNSFIYASYIDMEKPNKKSKINNLGIFIEIEKKDKSIQDIRKYTFKCKSKNNEVVLSFLNEIGEMNEPKLKINSDNVWADFNGIGCDVNIPEIRNIIQKSKIRLYNNVKKEQDVIFQYKKTYDIDRDNHFIFVIYPKMFSNYRKEMNITIKINNEEIQGSFFLTSIGTDERQEGVLEKYDSGKENCFVWNGKVNPKRIYIIEGILIENH